MILKNFLTFFRSQLFNIIMLVVSSIYAGWFFPSGQAIFHSNPGLFVFLLIGPMFLFLMLGMVAFMSGAPFMDVFFILTYCFCFLFSGIFAKGLIEHHLLWAVVSGLTLVALWILGIWRVAVRGEFKVQTDNQHQPI